MKRVKIDGFSVGLGLVAGLLAGGCGSYLLYRDRLRRRADAEIQSVRNHYCARAELAESRLKDPMYRQYILAREFTASLGYGDVNSDAGPDEDDEYSAGVDGDENNSGDEPVESGESDDSEPGTEWPPANRIVTKPYRISAEEFAEEIVGFQKVNVTYYAGDDVLADDKEDPLRVYVPTVGPMNVKDFGGVSGDPMIMFVRNHKLELDFEITLDHRTFTEVVLGYGNPSSDVTKEVKRR